MSEQKIIQKEDEIIGRMVQSSKIQAPANLKYRIMQQIETEKALSPQKKKPGTETRDMMTDFRGVFGAMYLLLFGLSVSTVITEGTEAILSLQFILPALLIVVTFTSFWALTRLDAHREKQKKAK